MPLKSYLPILLVALGGSVGALARYGLSGLVQGNRVGFPVGTLVVNLLGCLIMGFLARWIDRGIASSELRFALGLGFLGAFTTFSTFSLEALRLWMDANQGGALLYIGVSVLGCLLVTAIGYVVARMIWG